MMVKSAEQITVSCQEYTVSPEANNQRLEQQKQEGMLPSDTQRSQMQKCERWINPRQRKPAWGNIEINRTEHHNN